MPPSHAQRARVDRSLALRSGDRDPRRRTPSRGPPRASRSTRPSRTSRASVRRARRCSRGSASRCAGDLLRHVPHRYEDATTVTRDRRRRSVGSDVTVLGKVIAKGVLPTRKGLRVFQAVVQDASGMLEVAWPGQPFLDRTINKGDWLLCTGTVRFFHGRQLQPREFVNLGPEEEGTGEGRVLAVYPSTEGLSVRVLRALIAAAPRCAAAAGARSVARRRAARGRCAAAARRAAHGASARRRWPRRSPGARDSRSRNCCTCSCCIAAPISSRARRGSAPRSSTSASSPRALRAALPFTLTGAQVRAIREIVADMASPRRMHRLLQGDVGSGKTVVALFAALLAMENERQAALMAPTELLAEQHARTLRHAAGAARHLAGAAHRPTGRQGAAGRR